MNTCMLGALTHGIEQICLYQYLDESILQEKKEAQLREKVTPASLYVKRALVAINGRQKSVQFEKAETCTILSSNLSIPKLALLYMIPQLFIFTIGSLYLCVLYTLKIEFIKKLLQKYVLIKSLEF